MQEGVGLLQVADGALSQVTSLLNRAVTLATEASNGTLSGSQYTAANQEYQSILAEISNIGSTTTFNQKPVFNTSTNIYTGDSSVTGASIDDLSISALSSSNLGDTGGAITYTPASPGSSGSSSSTVTYSGGTEPGQISDCYGGGLQFIQSSGYDGSDIHDVLTGTYSFKDGASTESYTMGQTYNGTLVDSLATLATAIHQADASITTTAWDFPDGNGNNSAVIQLNQNPWNLSFVSDTLQDPAAPKAMGTLSGIGSGDSLSGSLTVNAWGQQTVIPVNAGHGDDTGASLAAAITSLPGSIWATYDSNSGTIKIEAGGTPAVANLTVDASSLTDTTSSGPPSPPAPATISYTAQAGQNLSGTDLGNATGARSALTRINAAITGIAAQDGYIGSQINTLNAVNQVLGTQLQNVTSAQNAVQATDYAQATSDLSKYEILTQTGIAALAQANSQQQEIVKLLQ